MELIKEINNNLNIEKNNKNIFLNNFFGDTINNAIDMGLKTILPDLIENQIIDIKNSLLENGLKSGIETAIISAINLGKSALGIFTGNFENIQQIKIAIDEGGIIDTISYVLDKAINKTYEGGYIDRKFNNMLKSGKNIILDNISNNIKNGLEEQTISIEKLEKNIEKWKEYYNNKNFNGMTKEFEKIEKQMENIIPLENLIKETKKVKILHNLIKNNGRNFDITQEQKELIEKLK